MTGPDCPACADLRQVVPISPRRQKLRKAHRVVMANLADNTIREVPSPSLPARKAILKTLLGVDENPDPPQTDFATLLDGDTFPDIILHYFRCTACKLLFQFAVNTYHGSGGEWKPVYDEDLV